MTPETYTRELLSLARQCHDLTKNVWFSPERREKAVRELLKFVEQNPPPGGESAGER